MARACDTPSDDVLEYTMVQCVVAWSCQDIKKNAEELVKRGFTYLGRAVSSHDAASKILVLVERKYDHFVFPYCMQYDAL
jgi:hypothetical protein